MNTLALSQLFDEKTFYKAFLTDLEACKQEIIIESPFITLGRSKPLLSIFQKLVDRGIKILIITRDPSEHEIKMAHESEKIISEFEKMGIQVLLCVGNHHRKLAILDRMILYEGSLNILSQTKSREIMRRINNQEITVETFNFLKLANFL